MDLTGLFCSYERLEFIIRHTFFTSYQIFDRLSCSVMALGIPLVEQLDIVLHQIEGFPI